MTRRSAKTKPVPSRTLPQSGAVPITLTMERLAPAATGLFTRAGSGGSVSGIDSLENGLKTCGKPFSPRTEVKLSNQFSAPAGSTSCTPASSVD